MMIVIVMIIRILIKPDNYGFYLENKMNTLDNNVHKTMIITIIFKNYESEDEDDDDDDDKR